MSVENGYPEQDTEGQLPSEKNINSANVGMAKRCKTYLATEVSTSHADVLLIACCFISGLVDSTIYNAYGTFVSMQTGNTIFIGLGGSTGHRTSKPYGWAKSLTSIVCFCLGCFFFSHACRFLGILRRGTIVASFLLQTIIMFLATVLIQTGVINGSLNTLSSDIDWWAEIPIALLSFQAAGQITASRVLSLSEIPTIVLTSLMYDFSSDPKLFGSLKSNVKRNRRICGFTGILVGAVAGGFIAEATKRVQVPLWIATGMKLVMTFVWMNWPENKASPI